MNLEQLRKEFENEMNCIPYWIDTTSTSHHSLWLSIMNCNDILMILIVDRVLKENSIIKIAQKFDEFIIETLMGFNKLHLEIAVYFKTLIDYLLERCVDEEQFEAAENLKVFHELYFQNIISYEND
jgi:hypothetical protein